MTSPTRSKSGRRLGRTPSRSKSPKRRPKSTVKKTGTSTLGGTLTIHETYNPDASVTEGGTMTGTAGTVAFTRKVKAQFKKRPEVYQQFVKILSQIRDPNADTIDLVNKVILLFDGYPALIKEFNKFLPVGCRIEIQNDAVLVKVYEDNFVHIYGQDEGLMVTTGGLDDTDGTMGENTGRYVDLGDTYRGSTMGSTRNTGMMNTGRYSTLGGTLNATTGHDNDDTVHYVRKVKAAFAKKPKVYEKFMSVLSAYHKGKVDELGTVQQIVALFKNHTDLVLGFNEFLPDGFRIHMYDRFNYVIEHPSMTEADRSQTMKIPVMDSKKKA